MLGKAITGELTYKVGEMKDCRCELTGIYTTNYPIWGIFVRFGI